MKAIILVSGGLDSILAAKIIKEQGIEILPLHFRIPFCQRKKSKTCDDGVVSLVKTNLGDELKVIDIGDDFLDLVLKPRYGFGSNMNPCIDCKIFMLKKAKELMQLFDAQFVVTGEVLGQRPMSQHRQALNTIERESGLQGLLLRPLSARFLPETLPEENGWVKRNKLFNFSGRSRRPQIELAKEFKISKYPNPAGGCLLTDPIFSNRLKDIIRHKSLNSENVRLLKVGRHFRLSEHAKLIVGRNEDESKELEALCQKGDILFMPHEEIAGPSCLGRGAFNEELISVASQIVCRYCDLNGAIRAKIIYSQDGCSHSLETTPFLKDRLEALRL